MPGQYGGLASSAQPAGDDRFMIARYILSLSINAIDDGAVRHLPLGGPYFLVGVNGVPVLAGHAGGIGRSAANADFLLVVGPRRVREPKIFVGLPTFIGLPVGRAVICEGVIVRAGVQVA